MKFSTLGFLTFVLWTTFVCSLISVPLKPYIEELDKAAEYRSQLAGGSLPGSDAMYFTKMARAISPPSNIYMLVLSAGCLAIMRTQRLVGSILLEAIQSSPDATAQAMRRALRPAAVVGQPQKSP
jgi:hypothetical protein